MFFSHIVLSTIGTLAFTHRATANAASEVDSENDAGQVQQTNSLLRGGPRRELTALSSFQQGPDGWYSQPNYAGHAYCYNRMNDPGTAGFSLEQCAQACIDCYLDESSCGPGLSGCGSFMLNGGNRCFLYPPTIPDDCEHNNPFGGMRYYELVDPPASPTSEWDALSEFIQGQDGWYSQADGKGAGHCYNRQNHPGTEGYSLQQCAQACILEGLGCGSFMLNGGDRCFLFPPSIPEDCEHNNPVPGMRYYELRYPHPGTN